MKAVSILFKLILFVGLAVYLAYAFLFVMKEGTGERCTSINVQIADSMTAGFVTKEDVLKKLEAAHFNLKGQLMDSIHGHAIEKKLIKEPFIQKATCYKTPGGIVNIVVEQRVPVLRVMADNGDNYYLDENGYRMVPQGYEADLVVVTGNVSEAFARKRLVPIGLFLRDDEFWNSQLEQIHVTPQQELDLFMRVGDQTIHAGEPVKIREKLEKLRVFYNKVMPQVGWNKYRDINISFDNQVICKKP